MTDQKTQEKTLFTKLQQIQESFTAVKKNKQNPHFKNTYIDINTLLQEVRPILQKHNILLIQPLTFREGKSILQTRLTDMDSGEEFISEIGIPDITDPQKVGSAITYYRRYSLVTIFLLETLDDDGETGAGRGVVEEQEKREKFKREIEALTTLDALTSYYNSHKQHEKIIIPMLAKRKKELSTTN